MLFELFLFLETYCWNILNKNSNALLVKLFYFILLKYICVKINTILSFGQSMGKKWLKKEKKTSNTIVEVY